MATVCEGELEGPDVPHGFHRYAEIIAPFPVPPWATPLDVAIGSDRVLATTYAQQKRDTYNYWADISGRDGVVGAAFASGSGFTPQQLSRAEFAITYMPSIYSHIYASELYGIYRAVGEYILQAKSGLSQIEELYHICDSQSALNSLQTITYQCGQVLLTAIRQSILKISRMGHDVQSRWVPAHSGIPGNERANFLARRTTGTGSESLKLGQDVVKVLKSALLRETRKE